MPRDPKVGVGVCALLHTLPKGGGPVQILLGHRCGDLSPNTWALPGGWHDAGEQPLETAVRELQEEAGIVLHPREFRLLGVYSHLLTSIGVWCATLYYEAVYNPETNGQPQVVEPDKLNDWRLFTRAELPQNLMGATKRAIDDFFGALEWY